MRNKKRRRYLELVGVTAARRSCVWGAPPPLCFPLLPLPQSSAARATCGLRATHPVTPTPYSPTSGPQIFTAGKPRVAESAGQAIYCGGPQLLPL
jgi:hypothetical protein